MSFAKPDKSDSGIGSHPLPCRGCGDLTPRPNLSSYGGWCGSCFASYCRDRPVQGPYVESQTVRDMKTRMRNGFRFNSLEQKAA